jgi:hypothetical protein
MATTTANAADHVDECTRTIQWIHRGHETLITGGGRGVRKLVGARDLALLGELHDVGPGHVGGVEHCLSQNNFGVELGPAGGPDGINTPLQLISNIRARALARKGHAVGIDALGFSPDPFDARGDVGAVDVSNLVPLFPQSRNRPREDVLVLFRNQGESLEHRTRRQMTNELVDGAFEAKQSA